MSNLSMPNRFRLVSFVLIVVFFNACAAQQGKPFEKDSVSDSFVFESVHVIPIDRPGVLKAQTVVVRHGKIVAIGPAGSVDVPSGAKRLPAKGKYLMPGLADMHVHLDAKRDLLLFLRHGVTRVRNMSEKSDIVRALGLPRVPVLREKVKSGEMLGPEIYTCGPLLDGDPPSHSLTTVVRNEKEAFEGVKYTRDKGFDCVKVYNNLSPENFEHVVRAAKYYNLPIMGHVPRAISLKRALETMKSIEHLGAYINSNTGKYHIQPEQWPEAIAQTAQSGVFNCPTLVMWDQHPNYNQYDTVKKHPLYKYTSWNMRIFWDLAAPALFEGEFKDKAGYLKQIQRLSKPLLTALYQGGSPLLIGTDTNLTGIFPGVATLQEMNLFVGAGISKADTLEAATLNAAKFFGDDDLRGSVTVGKQADLLLLNKNPLEDMQNIYETSGVMVQGKWLSRENLDARVEATL